MKYVNYWFSDECKGIATTRVLDLVEPARPNVYPFAEYSDVIETFELPEDYTK